MTKKAFRGFIAVLIVLVLLAVGWLIGWGITGNVSPVDWGKNQTQPEKENETEMSAFASSYATAKTMSAMVNTESGISAQSNIEINDTADYFRIYTISTEFSAKVINNVYPWDFGSTSNLFYGCRKDELGNTGLIITKDVAQKFFSSIDKNEYTLSGISLRILGNSDDLVTFREFMSDMYFLHVPISYTFDKVICLNFTANTPPREPVPLPADPVKDGHTFVGWYYDIALEIPYDGEPIYADTTLFAKFEINRYTVTFDFGYDTSTTTRTVDWNTAVTLSTPVRTGYTFKGWYLSDGTHYTNQAIKENTTLTARWEVIMCTVTFYVDGEVYETKQVEYGTPFVELLEYANKQNLIVSLISSLDGEVIDDCSAVSISENYSVVAEQMQGKEKFLNILKNYWQYIVAGVGSLAVICGVIGVAVSKRKN